MVTVCRSSVVFLLKRLILTITEPNITKHDRYM